MFSHHGHTTENGKEEILQEVKRLELENEETGNINLEKDNAVLKNDLEEVNKEVHLLKIQLSKIEIENNDLKEINKTLDVLNERMSYLVPGYIENEIDELRESNAILKATLMDREEQIEKHVNKYYLSIYQVF